MLTKITVAVFCKIFVILLMNMTVDSASAYSHLTPKENYFENALLAEILHRMENNILPADTTYMDPASDLSANLALMPRTYKAAGSADPYYEGFESDTSNPSIRDQEMLQHSSLWDHQFVSGGMGEGPNQMRTTVKTDASLPAYCNPPNPCPHGYTEAQGCITDFDNTAIFSREFQESQDCMCDGEHMFDCRVQENERNNKNDMITTDLENFLIQLAAEPSDNNFIAQKKYGGAPRPNPFLKGEQLPIAAKKGNRVN